MKFRNLDLSDNPVNAEHSKLGLPPIEESISHPGDHPILRLAVWLVVLLLIATVSYFAWKLFVQNGEVSGVQLIQETLHSKLFWSAVFVGLLAQTVDGALGMAYGITSTTFLLASGVSPAAASASVHIAEVFTTGVSGIAHVKVGNVNKSLFLRLLLPGLTGAILGAVLLTSIDGQHLKPYISLYLLLMGLYVISKIFRKIKPSQQPPRHVAKLAIVGGFVDTAGGGGWGPVVTTTLLGSGHDPRTTIGTVNFAEFFLTFASAIAFSLLIDAGPWLIVAGLVLGGLFAAPFAAILCKKLHTRTLLISVGTLISLVSAFNLYGVFFAN